eukprot:7624439-Pyramimonas_sp.AAC.1
MFGPKLSSMTGDIDSRVAVAREILMDIVVLPDLADPSKVGHMQDLGVNLTDQFSAISSGWSPS